MKLCFLCFKTVFGEVKTRTVGKVAALHDFFLQKSEKFLMSLSRALPDSSAQTLAKLLFHSELKWLKDSKQAISEQIGVSVKAVNDQAEKDHREMFLKEFYRQGSKRYP